MAFEVYNVHTVLCKKNANEFRRNSAIVQPKIRRYFERNFVIFSDENSNGFLKAARKFECIPEISLIQERNFEAISFQPKRNFDRKFL